MKKGLLRVYCGCGWQHIVEFDPKLTNEEADEKHGVTRKLIEHREQEHGLKEQIVIGPKKSYKIKL